MHAFVLILEAQLSHTHNWSFPFFPCFMCGIFRDNSLPTFIHFISTFVADLLYRCNYNQCIFFKLISPYTVKLFNYVIFCQAWPCKNWLKFKYRWSINCYPIYTMSTKLTLSAVRLQRKNYGRSIFLLVHLVMISCLTVLDLYLLLSDSKVQPVIKKKQSL